MYSNWPQAQFVAVSGRFDGCSVILEPSYPGIESVKSQIVLRGVLGFAARENGLFGPRRARDRGLSGATPARRIADQRLPLTDLMMVDFFSRLDDEILRKSAETFFQRYRQCTVGETIALCDNPLVNLHAELSRLYPKQFFAFFLEMLKSSQWRAANERWQRLFPDYGPQGTDIIPNLGGKA